MIVVGSCRVYSSLDVYLENHGSKWLTRRYPSGGLKIESLQLTVRWHQSAKLQSTTDKQRMRLIELASYEGTDGTEHLSSRTSRGYSRLCMWERAGQDFGINLPWSISPVSEMAIENPKNSQFIYPAVDRVPRR